MARKIQPALLKLIDDRLKANGAAQLAIKNKDPRSLMTYAFDACVGESEKGGNNKGSFVELCQKTVDGKAQTEPWCMSYVQSIIAYCEEKTGVKSPLFASEHCLTVWSKTDKKFRVKNYPAKGAVIIWQQGTSQSGHTGFVVSYNGKDAKKMDTNEGNTGALFRDGDGVYAKTRSTKNDGNMKVVGFLIPFEAAQTKIEPVVINRLVLSWEAASRPDTARWSDFVYKFVSENFADFDKAKDLPSIFKGYAALSKASKIQVICEFIVGMVYYESGFKPTSRMVETTMGTDPVTGKQVASEGLLQLSYQDVPNYKTVLKDCGIDWSKDKNLAVTDPKKTIFDPIINLDSGLKILLNQVKKKGSFTLSTGVYWAVIKIGGKYSKIEKIKERVANAVK